jgi:TonB family protein
MSTTLQDPDLEVTRHRTAAIALIGPNATHRRVMAQALIGSEARMVREFVDYPANLGDIPRLMEEEFDVVMIDVDSDQSYALQIVETIAAFNTAVVMVYSMRNDPDLLRECMRAGARDFLPLPEDAGGAPAAAGETEEPVALPVAILPVPIKDDLEQLNPADLLIADPQDSHEAQSVVTIPVPQQYSVPSRDYYVEPRQPDPAPSLANAELRQIAPQPQLRPEEQHQAGVLTPPEEPKPAADSPSNEFSEWDKLWIHSAMPVAAKSFAIGPIAPPAAEPAPKKRSGPVAILSGPQLVPSSPVAVESVEGAAPLFRQLDPSFDAQPRRAWTRWVILGGAPLVVAGLLMLLFMPTTRQSAPAAAQSATLAPHTDSSDPGTRVPALRTPTIKPSPAARVTSGLADQDPSGQTAIQQTSSAASDMMNAQLSAPSRISGDMKKPAPEEEAPAGFTPGAIESGDTVPGVLFATPQNVKVVPGLSAISAGVAEGMLIHKTEPTYPEFAKAARVSGTVAISATITKTGTIAGLHVLSGPAVLRTPAADAVRTWRYRPFLLNNQPVEVQTTIKVIFTLNRQ